MTIRTSAGQLPCSSAAISNTHKARIAASDNRSSARGCSASAPRPVWAGKERQAVRSMLG